MLDNKYSCHYLDQNRKAVILISGIKPKQFSFFNYSSGCFFKIFSISFNLRNGDFESPSTKISMLKSVSKLLTASLILLLNLFLFTALACLLEMLTASLFVSTLFSLTKTFTPFSAMQNSSFLRFLK